MALLNLTGVKVSYGTVEALHGIDLRVEEGEIVSILGANGAGKSTALLTISGLIKPREGDIYFDGKSIVKIPAHDIVGLGVAQAPEGRRVFGAMTVLENLRLGAFRIKNKNNKTLEWIFDLFPRLRERSGQLAGTLSGGEQQMLAIGRALMGRPKLLLLDEPSLGLAPIIIQQIFEIIKKVNEEGATVFLVEQNANQALGIADRGYVMENGRIVLEDTAKSLLSNPQVRGAYLGV